MDERDISRGGREADLVLGPGEMANVQDGTKGNVSVYVGPHKVSLSSTDVPVRWDHKARRFVRCKQEEAIFAFPSADEGSYIVLDDPASGTDEHPQIGGSSQSVKLLTGRTVNIPGPVTFPLWPGQHAQVLPGHTLRSNQYLIVRVINDEEAQKNWGSGIVRKQVAKPVNSPESESDEAKAAQQAVEKQAEDTEMSVLRPALTMGQLVVIKGNEVSFYIPPTGLAVVQDDSGNYVRDAITLERLEYCILLDENGEKRYVKGPDVVFPKPTEKFVRGENNQIKQHAIELNTIQGLHIKVIADYEEDGKTFKAGEELFFKGSDQPIYYPRPEHSIIKYGEQDVHFAVAVPKGEGRYVMNRESGDINTVAGPTMLLPDPRKDVIVRRVLNDDQVQLWFPGNDTALEVNQEFRRRRLHDGIDFITERHMERSRADDEELERFGTLGRDAGAGTRSVRDTQITRRAVFTAPESVTVDSKYDGAVRIEVWPGYAVLVVDKTNKRRVVIGPESTLLDHGETLMPMTLSTGRPKSDNNMIRTPYLRTSNNTVSDIITVETSDLFTADLELSYRVNFEGDDQEAWFNIDNYVKMLTDHLRSILKARVKEEDVQTFYSRATSIIRDTILGEPGDSRSSRPGKVFNENNMRVYDVEVLGVEMEPAVRQLLADDRKAAVTEELKTQASERKLDFVTRAEKAERKIIEEQTRTQDARHKSDAAELVGGFTLRNIELEHTLTTTARRIAAEIDNAEARLMASVAEQEALDKVAAADLNRVNAQDEQAIATSKAREEIRTEAIKTVMTAMTPELTAALQAFGDKQVAAVALEKIGPMSGVGQQVIDVMQRALNGVLPNALPKPVEAESSD